MNGWMTGLVTIALVGMLATLTPVRADEEDCETVLKDMTEAITIATKNFETLMGELKSMMGRSADDKTRATVKNRFCSASGELLGTTRATRAVAGACGSGQAAALAASDKSIKDIEAAISDTCK